MKMSSELLYLLKYALTSALAVMTDSIFYVLLTQSNLLLPGVANAVSTPVGFIIGWIISGKTLFRSHNIPLSGYVLWIAYQFLAILIYSVIIQGLTKVYFDKYVAKIIVITLSFCINSMIFRFIILKKHEKKN